MSSGPRTSVDERISKVSQLRFRHVRRRTSNRTCPRDGHLAELGCTAGSDQLEEHMQTPMLDHHRLISWQYVSSMHIV
jgi:hypothetical protein